MRDNRLYSIIVVVIIFSVGYSSSENGLRYERHPEGMDYDESYRIKVTRGQEVISSTLTQGGHYRAITLTVSAFNSVFVLDLHLNTYLFAVGYVERSFSKEGVVYHDVNHTEGHCYYLGKVRDQPQSSAAVSTCKGIVGYVTVGNVSYHIDPASNQLHGPHKVYRSRGDAKTVYRCGHEGDDFDTQMNPAKYNRRLKRFSWPQDRDKENKVVELFVANDHSQYLKMGNDVNAVIQRTKDIVNIASAGYQPLGIYIVLVGIEVWNISDKITVNSSNSSSTLAEWANYRMANVTPSHYNDNGILITNKTFDASGSVVGRAYDGKMCTNLKSAAIVSDAYNPPLTGAVMDHEMGHSFGLQHDDQFNPCACSDPSGKCVMFSEGNSGSPSFTWSQCSLDQFKYSFDHGLDICLYNVPKTIEPNVFCGNGIVENGEQCDCGNSMNQECNKACCDHATCQLISPATCAYGRCCNINTCQMLPCGNLCREKSDVSCDLAEFCDGSNHLCPNDTHLPDGANCTVKGVAAYCYNGQCRSHESQCELIWGRGTLASDDLCYYHNTEGDETGNCGINWLPNVTYDKCAVSDMKCGLLQCQDFNRNLSYYLDFAHIGGYSVIIRPNVTCHNVIFVDTGVFFQNPGYVPSGSKCGTEKMCVNQQCLDVSSLNTIPCATSCQTNEVCNNLGQCQSTIGSCQQSTTATATATTQTQNTNTPVSTTTTPTLSTTTLTVSSFTQTASAPSPSTRSRTLTGSSTASPSTQTSSTSTRTSSASMRTPSTSTQTTAIVLGVVLGALCLALAAALLYACCRSPGTLSANAGPSTATPPVGSAFTRGLSTPAQTELQRIPAEQFYMPQQQDWRLMGRTGQPVGGGHQYPNGFNPYSSGYNIASVYLTSSDNNMKVPQIVIR